MSNVIHIILNITNYAGLIFFGIYIIIFISINLNIFGENIFNLIDTLFLNDKKLLQLDLLSENCFKGYKPKNNSSYDSLKFGSDNVGFQGLSNYRIKNKLFLRNKDSINFGLIYYPHENIKRQQELIHIQKINNIKINTIIPITNDIKKLTGKSPSSGFATIIYLLKTYPNSNIYLMGFNFYNGANNWHNFNKEIQVINNLQKLNNNIKLFL